MRTVYRLVSDLTGLWRALVLLQGRPPTPPAAPTHVPRGLRTVALDPVPTAPAPIDDVVPSVDDVPVGGWRAVLPVHVAALASGRHRPDALTALVDARAGAAELDRSARDALVQVLNDDLEPRLGNDLELDVDLDLDPLAAPSVAQTEDPCLLTCSPHAPPAGPALRSARSRGTPA